MFIKEIINSQDREKYSKLSKEVGNIFNLLEWLDIFKEKIKIFGIFEQENELIGGFSLYKEKKFGLAFYRNPPFTPSIGPFIKLKTKNPSSLSTELKRALNYLAEFIERTPFSVISINLNKEIIDTQPFTWRKFKVNPCFTYLLRLDRPIENIWEEMSKTKKYEINKAMGGGLTCKLTGDLQIIENLVLRTFSRKNKKINKYYLEKILFDFSNSKNNFSFVTYLKKEPIAGVFCLYDKNTAYYLLGGHCLAEIKEAHYGANALSMWEAIKYAKNLRLKWFDFEGSMVPDIERYFRDFGGNLTPYYKVSKAKLPLEIILKFFKREIF